MTQTTNPSYQQKRETYTYTYNSGLRDSHDNPIKLPYSPVIKWYETNLTYEEKYRFGKLTPQEYMEWMQELCKKTEEESHTFWQNDTEERSNISNSKYEEFLANNHVDISNDTTVDVEKLLGEMNGSSQGMAADYEPDINEVLASVDKDIHGGNMLTQEEIEALFAEANAGN